MAFCPAQAVYVCHPERAVTLFQCHPERSRNGAQRSPGESKLSRLAGVSKAGARRRNPERSRGSLDPYTVGAGTRLALLIRKSCVGLLLFFATQVFADCIPFTDARQHVGSTQCVRGTVLNVKEGSKGVTFLDFCEDFRTCPFVVVVFPGDLKQVGDVRQLKGRTIEIKGTVTSYDGLRM